MEPQFDFYPSPWTTEQEWPIPDQRGDRAREGVRDGPFPPSLSFADEDVFVATGGRFPTCGAYDVKPVDAKFTHTLEPARPVTGIVTDKETGKPLAGTLIEVNSMGMESRQGGDSGIRRGGDSWIFVRTDASGRYRAAGAAGDSFWIVAHPDPASGYLPVRKDRDAWPVGAKVLEIDLALPRLPGRILRGRVVEAGSGRPVADGSVIYQPNLDNPHNDDEYEFDDPVLTDDSKAFALTVLPGAGLLAVEAPTLDYICVP